MDTLSSMVKEALNCVVHHRKTILTKNEKMMIALAEDMARSTTDISDVLLERWLELRCCFSGSSRPKNSTGALAIAQKVRR